MQKEAPIKSKKKFNLKSVLVKLSCIVLGILLFVGVYTWCCYTANSFVSKWRTIYVETALGTMAHRWLATSLLPYDVVNPVVEDIRATQESNIIDSSVKPPEKYDSAFDMVKNEVNENYQHGNSGRIMDDFAEKFHEIDLDTMPKDIDYSNIVMEDIVDLGIKTKQGDAVWAIDTENGILILQVVGDGYVGKLAIIKDSSQVSLKLSSNKGYGQTVTSICDEHNAVLGVNAGGFADHEGKGNGGTAVGTIISDGKIVQKADSHWVYQVAGFDYDDNFMVGKKLDLTQLRDAIEFYPAIIVNGEKTADNSYGMGIQPRTIVGQNIHKETLLLVVDGRQIGYSIGTTVSECADILFRYNAWTAMNMDGGSSSSMTYKGKMITRTSSPAKQGRYVPNAWVVGGVNN